MLYTWKKKFRKKFKFFCSFSNRPIISAEGLPRSGAIISLSHRHCLRVQMQSLQPHFWMPKISPNVRKNRDSALNPGASAFECPHFLSIEARWQQAGFGLQPFVPILSPNQQIFRLPAGVFPCFYYWQNRTPQVFSQASQSTVSKASGWGALSPEFKGGKAESRAWVGKISPWGREPTFSCKVPIKER